MITHSPDSVHRASGSGLRRLIVLPMLLALGGCVANSSNPRAEIESASMNDEEARIALRLVNPGGRDLTVEGLDCELSHGEMAFPVGTAHQDGPFDLSAGSEAVIPLVIVFDTALIENDSSLLHMNGALRFKDRTGFLGLASMDLTTTAFQLDFHATREEP